MPQALLRISPPISGIGASLAGYVELPGHQPVAAPLVVVN
jgi:hypothetical protein